MDSVYPPYEVEFDLSIVQALHPHHLKFLDMHNILHSLDTRHDLL